LTSGCLAAASKASFVSKPKVQKGIKWALGSGEAGRNLVRAVCLTYLWTKSLERSRESKHEPANSFKENLSNASAAD